MFLYPITLEICLYIDSNTPTVLLDMYIIIYYEDFIDYEAYTPVQCKYDNDGPQNLKKSLHDIFRYKRLKKYCIRAFII